METFLLLLFEFFVFSDFRQLLFLVKQFFVYEMLGCVDSSVRAWYPASTG